MLAEAALLTLDVQALLQRYLPSIRAMSVIELRTF